MGGPRLEIFKFAIYVTFPIAFMYWAGVPEWYERFVKPVLLPTSGSYCCEGGVDRLDIVM